MIKLVLFLLMISTAVASENPLVRLSTDREEYDLHERSFLLAEINISPSNIEYEFILDVSLNGSAVEVSQTSDHVWSAVSKPLLDIGSNSWVVRVYFIKKTFSRPIFDAMKRKQIVLNGETDPDQRERIIHDIEALKEKLVDLRRFIDEYALDFDVASSIFTLMSVREWE